MFASGEGVTKDPARAAELFQNACDGGDTQGCNALYAGEWRGTGGRINSISFVVNSSGVVELSADVSYSMVPGCKYSFRSSGGAQIKGKEFVIPVRATRAPYYETSVRGRFDSLSSVRGTMDLSAMFEGGAVVICNGEEFKVLASGGNFLDYWSARATK
jgi:TPR repeat protein